MHAEVVVFYPFSLAFLSHFFGGAGGAGGEVGSGLEWAGMGDIRYF